MRKPTTSCPRCKEQLVDADLGCVFCRHEREREAVLILIAAAGNPSDAALATQVDAIDTLRNLGYSKEQVLRAREHAVEGKTADRILEALAADERVEVAA